MTDGTTRREFLGTFAAVSLFPFEQEKPDLILHNGHVVTMNSAEPVAEAVAISRGRFFAVGKNADVMNLAASGVRKIDHDPATGKLGGRVAESAQAFFERAIPQNFTRDDHRDGVKLISKMLARTGITSATEAQGTPLDLQAYQDARDSGDLLFRAYCFINYRFIDSMIEAG